MPRLLVFAPAWKLLIDQQDNSASLLQILEGLTLHLSEEEIPAADGVVPQTWSIFTMWYREPSDEGKHYVQTIGLVRPDGETALQSSVEFEIPKRVHRVRQDVQGMPAGLEGEHILRLGLSERGSGEVLLTAEYPILISHSRTAPG